jgi:shikimate dehydrogenase
MQAFYTLADLQDWSHQSATLTPPARLAVIGDPIAHSKSPQMHNAALLADGVAAQYIRVQVPVGQVATALQAFRTAGFWGVNVTIPHKFEALAAVDEVDPLARQLGAVNTVHITPAGKLMGYNSDGPGFVNSVREAFQTELTGKRIIILGAGGGAGSAVAIQSALAGAAQVLLVNRTAEKLQPLCKQIQQLCPSCDTRALLWTAEALAAALPEMELIVNATSLGMKGEDAPLLPAHCLQSHHLVYDMVYRSNGLTSLGQAAKAANACYTDGQLLLLHQGAISYQHWFQKLAPLPALRAGLQSALLT